MTCETFLNEKERVDKLPLQDQKEFYERVLKEEKEPTSVRLLTYFNYAVLFYYEGNFKRTIEIMEQFVISYQSYEYIPEMISCFNVTGVACQCEGDYVMSRFFYTLALKVVKEHDAEHFYAYEYNNIALTYIVQKNYTKALEYIELAEKWLAKSDKKIGAFIYLNRSDIYNHLGMLDKALEDYERCIREYNAFEELPEDILICGITLYFSMGDREKYMEYISRVIDRLENMHASEFIDACKVIFHCALSDENYRFVEHVIRKMNKYMEEHADEIKVGVQVEELKYSYAKKIDDKDAMIEALEKKNTYYGLIVAAGERQRVNSMDKYLATNNRLQKAVQNERLANYAKTQFLANMSHDLRTPMNAIVGITGLMNHAIDNPSKLRSYLPKIQSSSKYMLGLISDLLDMSKMENGAAHLNTEPANLMEQLKQIEDIIRPQAAKKKLSFKVNTDIQNENIMVDATRLRQVLLNVLTNSVKYTYENGSIGLSVKELKPADPARVRYCFTIQDTGTGMDEELLEHIFDPFIRGEKSVVNRIQGSGLGMAIVKNIIDMMGGSIDIKSKPDVGTTIAITLELDKDETKRAGSKSIECNNSLVLKGMRFLCAEDNALNAEILEELLAIEGASCTIYSDGRKIVKAFDELEADDAMQYDAILMDIQMPNMDGYEAAKSIRSSSNEYGRKIPIVAMTANAFDEDIRKCLESGMNAHISKPISMQVLSRTMYRVLNEVQKQI